MWSICKKFRFQKKGWILPLHFIKHLKEGKQAREENSSLQFKFPTNINFLSKFAILTQPNHMKIADFCVSRVIYVI